MKLQFLWMAVSSRKEGTITRWLAVNSRREGRVTQCLTVSDGRGIELSQWLAMNSRRERRAVVLTLSTSSSCKSTRRVRGGLMLTYSGRRREKGNTIGRCVLLPGTSVGAG